MSCIVVARMKAKLGREDTLRAVLEALVPLTREEEGCISYVLHRSVEEPGLFLFHEEWRSRRDLEDHIARPHLQAFFGMARDLLAEPAEIRLWEAIA